MESRKPNDEQPGALRRPNVRYDPPSASPGRGRAPASRSHRAAARPLIVSLGQPLTGVVRYGIAVLLTGLALGSSLLFEPYLIRGVFVMFWPAVLATAVYAGLGPALLASALSVATVDYWLIGPTRTLGIADPLDAVPLAIFFLTSAVVSTLADRRRIAEQRALGVAEENAYLATQLENQTIEIESQLEEAQAMSEELEQTSVELQERTAEAEDASVFSRDVLASISDPFVVHDAQWKFRYINEAAIAIFAGSTRTASVNLVGRVLWDVYPTLTGTMTEREMRRAATERVPVHFEAFYAEAGTWSEMYCYPLADGGLATQWKDITARKKAEEALHYLDRATELLVAPLDPMQRLDGLARLVVPQLADWCTIEIVDESGRSNQVAVAHVDPDKVKWAEELNRRYPPKSDAPTGVPNVLRTGRPELYAEISDELLVAGAIDAEHLRITRALGLRSAMIVPLTERGQTFGAMTLVSAESRRRYTADDLSLASELARRAALAFDQARLFAEASAARQRADEANRAKSEFLATMSHELRTPLNAIAGYAELLDMELHGPITVPQHDAIARIQRSQRHLLGLINDVLNFARIEAGHVTLDLNDVPVHETLATLETLIAPQIRRKQITYAYEACDATLLVRADGEKVRQVLLNVLSNAIKFTPPSGRINMGCAVSARDIRISVTDSGRGIPADKLDRIFEPFVQLDAGPTREHEGTGLGLAISRDLARAMGGDLTVESKVDAGSTFTLTIPR